MRGKLWKDTSDSRPRSQPFNKPTPKPALEAFLEDLRRQDRTELRHSAAEHLGNLGPAASPALPELLQATIDIDAQVREVAFKALESIEPRWANSEAIRPGIPAVVAALRSRSAAVRDSAVRVLAVIGAPAAPALTSFLAGASDDVDTIPAITLLGRVGPAAGGSVSDLTRALTSQFPQRRVAAAEALARVCPAAPEAIAPLPECLKDSFPEVRAAAANCLAQYSDLPEPIVRSLVRLLFDQEPQARTAASQALTRNAQKAAALLLNVVQNRDLHRLHERFQARRRMAGACAPLAESDSFRLDPLRATKNLSWLASEAAADRALLETGHTLAIQLLGRIKPVAPGVVPAVAAALKDENPAIVHAAIIALGHFGSAAESLLPHLGPFMVHEDRWLREAALQAFPKIRNGAQLASVNDLLTNLSGYLARAGATGPLAIDAMALIGSDAVDALIGLLACEDRIAREQAAKALGRIGRCASDAAPALSKCLQDDNQWVRDAATLALKQIGSSV